MRLLYAKGISFCISDTLHNKFIDFCAMLLQKDLIYNVVEVLLHNVCKFPGSLMESQYFKTYPLSLSDLVSSMYLNNGIQIYVILFVSLLFQTCHLCLQSC